MQNYYDAHIFCTLVGYNRNVVIRTGVSNFSETSPFAYYGLTAKTTAAKK